MKIYINEQEIEIFKGASLGDILRKFSKKDYQQILRGKKTVVDRVGNKVLIDGELNEGDVFYIKEG